MWTSDVICAWTFTDWLQLVEITLVPFKASDTFICVVCPFLFLTAETCYCYLFIHAFIFLYLKCICLVFSVADQWLIKVQLLMLYILYCLQYIYIQVHNRT